MRRGADGIAARANCERQKLCIMSAPGRDASSSCSMLGATVTVPDWAMNATMDGLPNSEQASGGLPTEIGQCVGTEIAEITSRFRPT